MNKSINDLIPKNLSQKYESKRITIDDIIENIENLKSIQISKLIDNEGLKKLEDYLGDEKLHQFIEAFPQAFKNIIGKKYFVDLYIRYIELRESLLKKAPETSESILSNISQLDSLYELLFFGENKRLNSKQLQFYIENPKLLCINDEAKKTIDILGIENIKKLNSEIGLITNNDEAKLFDAIEDFFRDEDRYKSFKNGQLSYEEFKNEFANLLEEMRKNNVFNKYPNYDWIKGKFREEHPEIFISKDEPKNLEKQEENKLSNKGTSKTYFQNKLNFSIDDNPEKILEIAAYYDHDGTIRNFYRKIWNTENKEDVYCVFLEQRCLNLNEIYFHEWISLLHYFSLDYEISNLEYKYQNFFLTQDAWLTKAEELVAYYEKHLEFPKTYIVEEFLLSAHDIGNAVFNMLKAIFCEYGKKHSLTEDVESELKKAFLASLDIRVFVRDYRYILLETDIQKQISHVRSYKAEDWWVYINNVAEKITMDENVENTTFMPTFYLSREGYDKLRNYIGHSEVWRYKDKETEIWNNVVINENGKSKMIESMCIEFAEKNKEYHVTPYVILGNLSEAEMDLLFNYLLGVFSQTNNDAFKQFIHILKMPNKYAFDIKLSLCMSILSVLRMNRLIKASGITQDMLKGNDFDKISMNYGTVNETKIAFEALFEDRKFAETLRDQLSNTIINFLTQHAKSIPYSDCRSSDANATQAYCLKRAEDYLIDLEFKEEAQIQHRREKNIVYVLVTKFNNKECTISNYFKFFHTQNLKTSFNQQISAVLLLIHNGIIELKAVNTNGDSAFLKVGVITNLVAVNRRLFDYLPALIDLQKICEEQGIPFESWSSLFGRNLDRNHMGVEGMNLGWEFQYYANRFENVKRNLSDLAPLCKELNTKNSLPNAYNETQEMYRRILRKILKKD